MDTEHIAITEPVRRLEVFTGAGRRRTWRDEDKARIVAEIATSGDSVCAVARRHGLSPQQLFGWRRQLRDSEAERSEADGLQFVPAVVAAGSSPVPQRRAAVQAEASAGTIEVEINGVTDAKTLMAVLRALKGQRGSWVGARFRASTHARHPGRQINLQPKSGYPVKSAISRKKVHKTPKAPKRSKVEVCAVQPAQGKPALAIELSIVKKYEQVMKHPDILNHSMGWLLGIVRQRGEKGAGQ